MKNHANVTHATQLLAALGLLALLLPCSAVHAASTDLATAPMQITGTTNVLPNLMFLLDDSGSMNWNYLPDYANSGSCLTAIGATTYAPTPSTGSDCSVYAAQYNGVYYDPENTYTPGVTATGAAMAAQPATGVGVSVDGYGAFDGVNGTINLATSTPGGTNPFYYTIAPLEYCSDIYLTTCKVMTGYANWAAFLVGNPTYIYPAPVRYCSSSALANTNGAVTGAGKCQSIYSSGTYKWPRYGSFSRTHIAPTVTTGTAAAGTATTITLAAGASATNSFYNGMEVYISAGTGIGQSRFITAYAGATKVATVSSAWSVVPTATSTYQVGGRTLYANQLDASGNVIVNRSGRTDCTAGSCTYAQEMTNFANWYAYYHTRLLMMKTSAGAAFSAIDANYRVGFITLNPNNPVSASKFLPVSTFDAAQKTAWYTKFYSQTTNGSTPMREALSRVGRYFAGKSDGINSGMTPDPMQYSCQPNYVLVTTDGYWNQSGGTKSGVMIDGVTPVGNQDNDNTAANFPTTYTSRATGTYDGALLPNTSATTTAGGKDTLADVAMYYYKTDLRTNALGNCGVSPNFLCSVASPDPYDNVPTTTKDTNPKQHMVTFTLGLVNGLMTFRPDYETDTSSTNDFYKIKTANVGGCSWNGAGICNWPSPLENGEEALDDLWHAAVNGRGSFYNAGNPAAVATGLANALSSLKIRTGAAAAAATSSPNVTQTDRTIFSSIYRTAKWDGDVYARYIDPATGSVLPAVVWSAQAQLDLRVGYNWDSRAIITYDDGTAGVPGWCRNAAYPKTKVFWPTCMTAAELAWFQNLCSPVAKLSQCASILPANAVYPYINNSTASGSSWLPYYLRGMTLFNITTVPGDITVPVSYQVFRARDHALGDTVNAKPAYIKVPTASYTDTIDRFTATAIPLSAQYAAFKTNNASRLGIVYIGANDGMLHAFNSNTGDEVFAHIPRMVLPKMYVIADQSYASLHKYYVDGSPVIGDMYDAAAVGWKTLLIAGLNGGGRGYYALDVTNPSVLPTPLWEICADPALCSITDPDFGYTYGNPVLTKRASDGRWVVLVTSGYNNDSSVTPAGTGIGYLYVLDAKTGTILNKISTGSGTAANPSGLAKITPWIDSAQTDNTTKYVYGGDLNGDVWRFDLTAAMPAYPAITSVAPAVMQIAALRDATNKPQSVTTRPEVGQVAISPLLQVPVVMVGTGRYLGVTDLVDPATLGLPQAYQQSVYAFKDTAANLGNLRSMAGSSMVQQTITPVTSTSRTSSNNPVNWATQNGWFVDFNPGNTSPGERVNIDPQLVQGTLFVVTNVPNSDACTAGGDSWLYQFNFRSGAYVTGAAANTVATKVGNSLTVGMVVVGLTSGQVKAILTTATGATTTVKGNTNFPAVGRRSSWRELNQ